MIYEDGSSCPPPFLLEREREKETDTVLSVPF
jgi:hypothetical protein